MQVRVYFVKRNTFQAVLVYPDPLAFAHRREIAEFGVKQNIPVMAGYGFAEAGCLLSFDAYYPDLFRRMATDVDKILRARSPLVSRSTTDHLQADHDVKTTRTLGLTVSQSLLLRADQLIE